MIGDGTEPPKEVHVRTEPGTPKEVTEPLVVPRVYEPKIPYRNVLAQPKKEKEQEKLKDLVSQLSVRLPFRNACQIIPSLRKYMKAILEGLDELLHDPLELALMMGEDEFGYMEREAQGLVKFMDSMEAYKELVAFLDLEKEEETLDHHKPISKLKTKVKFDPWCPLRAPKTKLKQLPVGLRESIERRDSGHRRERRREDV
ncbi:unnamed protein product [Microthlaspi erraticum]|uniref:Uncharacterized protein n=1 Tax=Microthlaspi erraticum TaxID=1685480 RepID=A0A6D2IAK5_9BRAS|nr:unnamed protein product [Microthlaspi erraticum]